MTAPPPGEKSVTLSYRGVSTTITLTVRPAVETIEVTFSLLGDDAHGAPTEETGTHTMAGGGLQTWIPETTYEVASDATVKDVFEMALTDAGMTWVNSTGTYVESITNGSTTLGEMTNGASSGWLFLLNGEYGLLGMDQQTLQSGDKITFHYTDDYSVEFGGGGEEKPDEKPDDQKPTVDPDLEALRKAAGNYLASAVTNPTIASVGGDWAVFGLARAGYSVNEGYYATYYGNVAAALKAANGILHNYKYTEYSRVILGLTAAGYDPSDVGGYNLLAPLADYDKVIYQGLNGAAYALLALDSHNYAIPTAPAGKTQTTRENLVSYLLSRELPGGGWTLSGDAADADLTAIVLQALAPYRVSNSAAAAAIDRGLAALSGMQKANGGFASNGTETW